MTKRNVRFFAHLRKHTYLIVDSRLTMSFDIAVFIIKCPMLNTYLTLDSRKPISFDIEMFMRKARC